MGYSTYSNIDQTIEWIKSIIEKEDELVWTIILKEENIIIGAYGIKPSPSEQGYWEIGYNLHYDYWNNGFCTEAIKALIKSAYEKNKIKNFFTLRSFSKVNSKIFTAWSYIKFSLTFLFMFLFSNFS